MADFIFPIIVAFALGFVAGIVAFLVYIDSLSKEKPAKVKTEDLPPIYTEEEIELAQFLEDRQAINEAFLSAQAELLKEFRNS